MAEIYADTVTLRIGYGIECTSSCLRSIPGDSQLKWTVDHYPQGRSKTSDVPEACITISGSITAIMKATFVMEGDKKTAIVDVKDSRVYSIPLFKSCMYNCRLECTVTFRLTGKKLALPMVHEMLAKSYPSDSKIIIGPSEITIHRDFLSMISPVFKAMFGSDTKEAQTGIVEITDYTADTVNNALDYCYGRPFENKSAAEVTDMLRFYDKYDMQASIEKLEGWLESNISVNNFAPIAAYAWQYSQKSLQNACAQVFHIYSTDIICGSDFVNLEPDVIVAVIKACKECAAFETKDSE
uniref:BTB domain-containing protein n=1 Tax=Panagrellus redivivus TaxID=6233 RepID=A0A7E4WAJ1_PANRE